MLGRSFQPKRMLMSHCAMTSLIRVHRKKNFIENSICNAIYLTIVELFFFFFKLICGLVQFFIKNKLNLKLEIINYILIERLIYFLYTYNFNKIACETRYD